MFIFKLLWRTRLKEYKVVKIKGWRTFLVDNEGGQRETVTFLFGKTNKI